MRWLLATAFLLACGAEDVPFDAPDASPPSALVGDFVSEGCSTQVVLGLSLEIADEVSCIEPGALDVFSENANVTFTSAAVLPYLSRAAIVDLEMATSEPIGESMRINSAFRTVAQQYLLSEWFRRGLCGITAAATPGSSNHESGRAIDISNFAQWRARLGDNEWQQTVPGDEVHYDHLGSPDNRGLDVEAFQRLWNRANPDDPIDVDGSYGPQTEARLAASPADGFGGEPGCAAVISDRLSIRDRQALERGVSDAALAR